jgi:hexokinase
MSSTKEWLQQRIYHYRAHKTDTCEAIEALDDLGKLGQGFTSAYPLEVVDIGDGTVPRTTFVNKNLDPTLKLELIKILK